MKLSDEDSKQLTRSLTIQDMCIQVMKVVAVLQFILLIIEMGTLIYCLLSF